jgi:PAS domain S-box-containing protein
LGDALHKAAAERKRGEEASQRLAAIVRSSSDAIISKTLEGIVTSWNASAERMFGYTADEMIGQSIRILIPPDRQQEEDEILLRLGANQRIEPFETVRLRKDGRTIPVSVTISPLTDAVGRAIGASKIARDISEQKAREEQVQLLLRELNHRTKNSLAVVQAIAHQTAGGTPSDFLERFSQRLRALAVNQDLVAKNEWHGIDLEELLQAQLAPFVLGKSFRAAGPALRLSPAGGQAIGMAVHELATNASKYGALSSSDGTVEVTWSNDAETFTMMWSEFGGPRVQAPVARGFGSIVTSTMIEQAVKGHVQIDYASSGLIWRLVCPLSGVLGEDS